MSTQQQKEEFLKAHPEVGELANGKLYRVAKGTSEYTEVRTVLDGEIRYWKDENYYTN